MGDTKIPDLIARSQAFIPGGVNSSTHVYPPEFITTHADGAYFWDQNNQKYTDYLGAWGPMILGYNHPRIRDKVKQAIDQYDLYGVGTTRPEVDLAEKICTYVKGVQKVLLCLSGSEATYHAIRAARSYTGRNKLIKMQGGYHGWHDSVLLNLSSEPDKIYQYDPASTGMLKATTNETLICRINDLDHFWETCRSYPEQIAAIIVDPYCSIFGCLKMSKEYIEGLRKICDQEGIVLIFDEVVSGFRLGLGGVTALYDVTPDLVCMGKAIANGYPVAALGGKNEIMNLFNTRQDGTVCYQATYYGNPILASAALATIEEFEKPGFYEHLYAIGDRLCKGLCDVANRIGIEFSTINQGSLIGLYFGRGPFRNYDDLIVGVDRQASNLFRQRMIEKGHYFATGPFRRIVTSYAHSSADIDDTLAVAEKEMTAMKNANLLK